MYSIFLYRPEVSDYTVSGGTVPGAVHELEGEVVHVGEGHLAPKAHKQD